MHDPSRSLAEAVRDLPGPVDVPPLVLLHGWTGSKEDFAPVATDLARARRVVVPDLPGHGAADAVPEGYGLDATTRWVLSLLDRLGVGELHLLGHSLGGLLAQRVAHRAAGRVRSLVLVGTGPGTVGPATADRVRRIARATAEEGPAAGWAVASDGVRSDGVREAFVRDRFLGMSPDAVVGGARALLTASPNLPFLRGMDMPVLVCHGEGDDAWLPVVQRGLARMIPGASYAVVPDALHSPAVENPSGFLAVVEPFLAAADLVRPGAWVRG